MPDAKTQANRDSQTYPFILIPKAFFTRFKPSLKAIAAYTAIKFYASNREKTCEYKSIRTMANTVGLSESSFKRGLDELVKRGAVRVRHRSSRTPRGKRMPLPNLYEIVNLDATSGEPI